jgi:hypothetical protein
LTEYGDLSKVEAEETETAAVMVKTAKTAEATETAAVTVKVVVMTVKAVATVKTATMAEVTEMVAAVMTMAEKAAVDITDGKGASRWHIGGNTGL